MNNLELKNYNLEKTLLGGQAFNWDFINDAYYGFTMDKIIKIVPQKNGILWQTYPEANNTLYLENLLNFNNNFDTILASINKDEIIGTAIQSIKDVRLLKQDFNQTLLSFILTSHKNIKAVRKVVRDLSKSYGEKIIVDGITFYTFPKIETIAQLTEKDIRKVGAGFRSGYVLQAAKVLAGNENYSAKLQSLTESDARKELLKLRGVGDKVADCVLTFALGFYTVTPIDIWAMRVLSDLYKVNTKTNYKNLRKWYFDYFGEHTAWAGQFLFEYLRENYKDIKIVSDKK